MAAPLHTTPTPNTMMSWSHLTRCESCTNQSNLHKLLIKLITGVIQCFTVVLSLLNFCRHKTDQTKPRVCLSPLQHQWATIALSHIPGCFRLLSASAKLAFPQATSTTIRLSKTKFTSAKLRDYAELQPWIWRCKRHYWRGWYSARLLCQWKTHSGSIRSRQPSCLYGSVCKWWTSQDEAKCSIQDVQYGE